MKKKTAPLFTQHQDFIDDKSAALLLSTPKSAQLILWVIALFFIFAVIWASYAQLDKVTSGNGKVIPSSQLQVVQNLEGGIVKEVLIKEGQQVTKGQALLFIDDTLAQSSFREKDQDLANLKAQSHRLQRIIDNIQIQSDAEQWQQTVSLDLSPLSFESSFEEQHPQLVAQQKNEYGDLMNNLHNELKVTAQQIKQKQQEQDEIRTRIRNLQSNAYLSQREYNITKPLADEGVVPRIELLKLQRSMNDSKRELTSAQMQLPVLTSEIEEIEYKYINIALDFRAKKQQELSDITNQLATLSEVRVGLEDKVKRTKVTSPVTGTIQKIHVNTIGGVVQPGMDLVEIVPSDDHLIIETKIAPQDIGFLSPELTAMIKFTAYDFTQYGGLEGQLETISADTIQDEEGNSFYLVKIRTKENSLQGADGRLLPIIPGMTATADIITGKRSVLDYLLKPVLKAKQTALRE